MPELKTKEYQDFKKYFINLDWQSQEEILHALMEIRGWFK